MTITKISNEISVNTYTYQSQWNPRIDAFSDGKFVIVWDGRAQASTPYAYGAFAQIFDRDGNKLGSQILVDTPNDSNKFNSVWTPDVAVLLDDNFIVVESEGTNGIMVQKFSSSGDKIGSPVRANLPNGVFEDPSISAFPSGDFVVTWSTINHPSSGYGIYAQYFDSTITKIGTEFQVSASIDNEFKRDPSIATFTDGKFIITWARGNQNDLEYGYGVYGQLFSSERTKIGGEFLVNTYTLSDQQSPEVRAFSDNSFVITWQSYAQDGNLQGVYGQKFDSDGNKVANEFQVNTYTFNSQTKPSIAIFPDDRFVISWASYGQSGSNDEIYIQEFNSNCTKIGNEFHVNNYTDGAQTSPAVTVLSNNEVVVTWQGYYQDGSEYGVFAQKLLTDDIAQSSTPIPIVSATPSHIPSSPLAITESVTPIVTSTSTSSHSIMPIFSASTTSAATASITASASHTAAISESITAASSVSASLVPSPTSSISKALSASPTASISYSSTISASITPTSSVSSSLTPSPTSSTTKTLSSSATTSPTSTPSVTPTPSPSPTKLCFSGNQKGKITWNDFNGDNKVDLICEHINGEMEICLSTGSGLECSGNHALDFNQI